MKAEVVPRVYRGVRGTAKLWAEHLEFLEAARANENHFHGELARAKAENETLMKLLGVLLDLVERP